MRWRPQPGMHESLATQAIYAYAPTPEDLGRSAPLAEALARLEAATRLRDGEAVARILDGLGASDDGRWLLRQCVAAGLREVAAVIADSGLEQARPAGAA